MGEKEIDNKDKKIEEESEKTTKNQIKKEERQLKWVISIICIAILAFILIWFYIKTLDKFEYGGVQFQKVKVGQIDVYQSRDYFFTGYRLNFRIDPRENDIPITGIIKLEENITFISSSEITYCEGSMKPALDMIIFFTFAGGNIIPGTTNKTEALLKNSSDFVYSDCQYTTAKNSIIKIEFADETRIEQDSKYPNCHIIKLKNCTDFEAASERFIMAAVAEYNNKKI